MDEQLYVVHWKHKTGHTGNDFWRHSKKEAQRIADEYNRELEDTGYYHWVEPVGEPAEATDETPTP